MGEIKGFTLMETLIYIALFTLIIFSGFITAFELLKGSETLSAKKVLIEESSFLKQKVEGALSDVVVLNFPSLGVPNTDTLSLTNTEGDQLDIRLNAGKVEVRTGGASHEYLPLNTDNTSVTALNFEYIPEVGASPRGVKATFTLNGVSFSTTKYLKK
jgi:hypothetical protein